MGFDPYKFVARREADREEGAARVWDDTYNQEKYYDAEARKQSWMQERYGLGIYKNIALAARPGVGANKAITDAVTNSTQYTDPEFLKAVQDRMYADASGEHESSIWETSADVIKAGSRLGTSALNTPLGIATNIAMRGMEFSTDPGTLAEQGPASFFGEVFTNTDLGATMNVALTNGLDDALGEAGGGDGFFVQPYDSVAPGEKSLIGQTKQNLAKDFWTLDNGDAATIGRAVASGAGVDKDSSTYGTLSGAIDLVATLALDPLNVIPIGPASKAGRGAATLGKLSDDIGAASKLVDTPGAQKVFGPGGKYADLTDDALHARENVARMAENDPVLAEALRSQGDRLGRLKDAPDKGAKAAKDTDYVAQVSKMQRVYEEAWSTAQRAAAGEMDAADSLAKYVDEFQKLKAQRDRLAKQSAKARQSADNAKAGVDNEANAKHADRADDKATKLEEKLEDVESRIPNSGNELDDEILFSARERVRAAAEELEGLSKESKRSLHDYNNVNLQMRLMAENTLKVGDDLDPADIATGVKAQLGLTKNHADANQVVQHFLGGDMGDLPTILSRINDSGTIYKLANGRFTPQTAHALAAAKTPEETMGALLTQMSKGGVEKFDQRILRKLSKLNRSAPDLDDQIQALINPEQIRKHAKWRVNSPRKVSAFDSQAMTEWVDAAIGQVFDFNTGRKGADKVAAGQRLQDKWLTKMIDAQLPTERKSVAMGLIEDMIDELPALQGVADEKFVKDFKVALKKHIEYDKGQMLNMSHNLAAARVQMGRGKASLVFDSVEDLDSAGVKNLITHGQGMLMDISTPDFHKMNRTARKLFKMNDDGSLKTNPGVSAADYATSVYDAYLRPLLLVGRPAYVALQILDAGSRNAFSGYSSPFTHSWDALRLGAGVLNNRYPKLKHVMGVMEKELKDLDGTRTFDIDEDWVKFASGYDARKGWGDFYGEAWIRDQIDVRPDGANVRSVGARDYAVGEEGFELAWADEVYSTLSGDGFGIRQRVFDVLLSMREEGRKAPAWLVDHSAKNKMPLTTPTEMRAAAVDWFKFGEGRSYIDNLIGATWEGKSKERIVAWENRLDDFLFGDYAESVTTSLDDLTGGWDSRLVDFVDNLRTNMSNAEAATRRTGLLQNADSIKFSWKGVDGATVFIDASNPSTMRSAWAKAVKSLPDEVRPPVVRTTEDVSEIRKHHLSESLLNKFGGFFEHASMPERAFAHTPFLRDRRLIEIINRIPLLTKEDAVKVAAKVRKEAPSIPARKLRESLGRLDDAVKAADGQGAFTPSDIDDAAKGAAKGAAGDQFYGIKGRNMLAKRLVWMAPFVQAWANPLKFYAKNTTVSTFMDAQRAYQTLQSEDSGVMYDWFGVRDDPSQGVLYLDDFGNQKFRIPLMGSLWAKTPFANEATQPSYMEFQANRLNPINFGEELPGLGPLPQQLFNQAMKNDTLAANTPVDVKNALSPYRKYGVGMTPAWVDLGLTWAGVKDPAEHTEKFLAPAMSSLLASSAADYTNDDGFIDKGGENRLIEDAKGLAEVLYRDDVVKKGTVRGVADFDVKTTNASGEEVMVSEVRKKYFEKLNELGDSGEATAYILQMYGTHNVMYLVGKRDSIPEGDEAAYKWVRSNSDSAKEFSDILPFISPALGQAEASSDLAAWMETHGGGKLKDANELVASANEAMYKAGRAEIHAAAEANGYDDVWLDKQLAQYSRTAQQTSRSEVDMNWVDENVNMIETAIAWNGGSLTEEFPAMAAAKEYMSKRSYAKANDMDGPSFEGMTDADVRAGLLHLGNELSVEFPEFGPMWNRLLKREVLSK